MSNLEIFTCSDESSSMVFIPKLYPMVMVYSGSEKYLFALNYTLCVRHRLYLVCIGCGAIKPRTFHRIILWNIQFLAQGVMMKLQHSWPPLQKTVIFVHLYNIYKKHFVKYFLAKEITFSFHSSVAKIYFGFSCKNIFGIVLWCLKVLSCYLSFVCFVVSYFCMKLLSYMSVTQEYPGKENSVDSWVSM